MTTRWVLAPAALIGQSKRRPQAVLHSQYDSYSPDQTNTGSYSPNQADAVTTADVAQTEPVQAVTTTGYCSNHGKCSTPDWADPGFCSPYMAGAVTTTDSAPSGSMQALATPIGPIK